MTAAEFTAIKAKLEVSQSQLSKLISKSVRTISRYETGATGIPRKVQAVMIKAGRI